MDGDGYCQTVRRCGSRARSRLLPRSAISRVPEKGDPAPGRPAGPPNELGRSHMTDESVPVATPAWSGPDWLATSPPTR